MRISVAVDFDGVLVDRITTEPRWRSSSWVWELLADKDVSVVSARDSNSKKYLNKVAATLFKRNVPVYCEGSVDSKIEFLNKKRFDMVIDDSEKVVRLAEAPVKVYITGYKSVLSLYELFQEKKLYSPALVKTDDVAYTIDYSHRSEEFKQMYKDTVRRLQSLIYSYTRAERSSKERGAVNIVFIQGSASAAIEAALSSVMHKYKLIGVVVNGVFGQRAAAMARRYFGDNVYEYKRVHDLIRAVLHGYVNMAYVTQFETSTSIHNDVSELQKVCEENDVPLIIDAVSAFPYYTFPYQAEAVILSSSKQIGGMPVMGIVAYKDRFVGRLKEDNEGAEYLSLLRYKGSAGNSQTPHTSLIPQMQSLNLELATQQYKRRVALIDQACTLLLCDIHVGVIGHTPAPVLTIKVKNMKMLQELLGIFNIELYYNKVYMEKDEVIQIGCFGYDDIKYYEYLAMVLKLANKRGYI